MKKLFLICSLSLLSSLFGVDYLLPSQQAAKNQIGIGVSSDNWMAYLYGIRSATHAGVGNSLLNDILVNHPVPTNGNLLKTTGMIDMSTYPLVSKFNLLVSPTRYAALPFGENFLIKNQNLFPTIQSAIDYALSFTNDNTLNRWTIFVDPGTYNEDLTIGGATYATGADIAMSITLAALGKVTIGTGAAITVTWNVTKNNLAGEGRYPSLFFTAYRTNDTSYNARWILTNGLTFNRANTGNPHGVLTTVLLQMQYTTINGPVDLSRANGVANSSGCVFDLFECVFNSTFNGGTTASSILMNAQGCVFNGLLTANQYHNINGCKISAGMTCSGGNYSGTAEGVYGIYRSTLNGTFGPVGATYLIDHFTNDFSPGAVYTGIRTIMQ